MKRSLAFREITKFKEKFLDFTSTYFGKNYAARYFRKWEAVIDEIERLFNDGNVGGATDLEIFDHLLKIATQDQADSSKIFPGLCFLGAFEAIKVHKIIKLNSSENKNLSSLISFSSF